MTELPRDMIQLLYGTLLDRAHQDWVMFQTYKSEGNYNRIWESYFGALWLKERYGL